MMKFTTKLMIGLMLVMFISCSVFKKNQKNSQANNASLAKIDTLKRTTRDTTKAVVLKPYNEIITANALTKKGLFTVHKINDRYFFEIPNGILDKDIMIISRLEQAPASGIGYAGDQIGESQIEFSRGPGNKLFIRVLFYNRGVSTDSSANGMYRALQASNLQPIQAAFDIKAIRPDSTAVVVDVTDFLNSDNPLLYFDGPTKQFWKIAYQKDKSYVDIIQAFPSNVEIRTVNTYLQGDLPVSFALNVSFVSLPDQPMQPRYFDNRVGYFKRQYLDYDAPDGVKLREMIIRWRLEPRDEDKALYLRGELAEPQKPIVYYIDPATPKKWVPYLIQGVNDWQRAFEKAGFKNAIYALEAPTNDSTFSLLDARHNAIIYKASADANASGPNNINDPRSGEILETHINWYHNVQTLLHDWYMVQAGPNDPGARKMVFDDSLMGELIRFVCSHEVGHTLGLRHNMGASSSVPTDSLRSKTYLDKNGFCPSIMDYARFNYVAQPEDHLTRSELMPRIGIYDEWAIEFGYRWLPQLKTREQEEAYMNQWIIDCQKNDKRLWWGEQEAGSLLGPAIIWDPRRQMEDLGDDAMKAGYFGIQNLKRVVSCLTNWSVEPNQDYSSLDKMRKEVIGQYARYAMHVANNIGNKYWTEKAAGQAGPVVQFIPRDVQKRAMEWLDKEVFDTPDWLYSKEIFSLVGGDGVYSPIPVQMAVINWLVTNSNYITMSFAQTQQPKDAYTYDECLTDMDAAIWKELDKAKPISFARRNLQKLYVERLIQKGAPAIYDREVIMYDFYPIMQKHMQRIVQRIDKMISDYKDEDSRLHLLEVKNRFVQALNSTRFPQGAVSASAKKTAPASYSNGEYEKIYRFFDSKLLLNCTNTPTKGNIYSPCWYPLIPEFFNKN